MHSADFDAHLDETLSIIRKSLASKGVEYAPDEDDTRFHNFNVAAAFNNETPERALWGMLTKHLVSLSDMVQLESTDYPIDIWYEKIGDALNYLVLLKAMVAHHRDIYEMNQPVEAPPSIHQIMNVSPYDHLEKNHYDD